jgi:hypothetical protein
MMGVHCMGFVLPCAMPSLSGEDAAGAEVRQRAVNGAGSSSSRLAKTWAACWGRLMSGKPGSQ